RDQWLSHLLSTRDQRQNLESVLTTVIEAHLQKVQSALVPFRVELLSLAQIAADNRQQSSTDDNAQIHTQWSALPEASVAALPHWRQLAKLCLTDGGGFRRRLTAAEGFPPESSTKDKAEKAQLKQQKKAMLSLIAAMEQHESLGDLLHSIRQLPNPNYTDSQWQLLDSLTRLLTHLAAQLKITFQQWGQTDYIEITQAAIEALGEEDRPTDLALALDYKLQHILVDEFQDTSSPQLRLLKKLTAGWQTGDGRTLFCVGDAMQSCYSFRDANVGIFLDSRQRGIGDISLKPLDLSVNFRSQATLVRWFNEVFSAILPKTDDTNLGAVSYKKAVAVDNDESKNRVNTQLLIGQDSKRDAETEARLIAQLIDRLKTENPQDSIAILVRKRSQVGAITQALKVADIVFQATEIDHLREQMIIQDLLNLVRALLFPHDRIAWLGLLRAPWCGLAMDDLYHVANFSSGVEPAPTLLETVLNYREIAHLSDSGTQLLQRLADQLRHILAEQGRRMLRQWIESAWLTLGGGSLLVKEEEFAMVAIFFHNLQQQSVGWRLQDWERFEKTIDRLYANDHDASSPPATVKIMTIHKSKGLEFDHVILPGLDQRSGSDSGNLLVWQEWLDPDQQSRLIISPIHPRGDEKDAIYQFVGEQRNRKQQLEADRLLYVACTRAIKHLHLFGYVRREEAVDGEHKLGTPPERSMLYALWPHLRDSAQIISVDDCRDDAENPLAHPSEILRQPVDWQPPTYPVCRLLQPYRPIAPKIAIDSLNRAPTDGLLQRQRRYFGTVLHQALQQVIESGYSHWNQRRIQQYQNLWQQKLQQLGVREDQASSDAERIAKAIERTLLDTRGRWLLDNSHPQSACELSLWTYQRGEAQEFIIDRTFVDNDSHIRWIIDYKSSEPASGQNLDDFALEQESLYRAQLQRYAYLFKEHSETIRTALYYPILGHWQLVELDG
ncbi:MAG: ATP-dependent helicase/nuclease subunit A, partial [Cellvibrionaceae bacterium]